MTTVPRLIQGRPLAVRTDGLIKQFRDKVALSGFSLTVPEGAFFVLVGPNGSGKTTAFRVMLGLCQQDAGSITVFGRDPDEGAAVRANIGFVPERHTDLFEWMTVRQMLDHHAAYHPAWDDPYAEQLIAEFALRMNTKIQKLSKGEARRVQLVMALAHRPALLLLDEPTDGLDPLARDRMFGLLADHIADNPTTVIVATHLVYEMDRLADHLGVMRDGRVIAQVTRDDLARHLRRYTVEVPDGWRSTATLGSSLLRRNDSQREFQWTVWGDERAVLRKLSMSGAFVRDIAPLTFQDAALALLSMYE
ncbi:MAG: ABC transporter ATP-binding protein [Gemmatimonadota bacterium]